MHEMAIAEGILDIALDYAARNDAKRIGKISLLLGEMSGVETEAMEKTRSFSQSRTAVSFPSRTAAKTSKSFSMAAKICAP